MGLLNKAIAINNAHTGSVILGASGSVQSFIADFHRKNPQFHIIVLQGRGDIKSRIACHGAAVSDLPGGNSLVLLPGALDRELFAHRLSQSTGFTILSQLGTVSLPLAFETLSPWLQ
jgi:hypothetical protein